MSSHGSLAFLEILEFAVFGKRAGFARNRHSISWFSRFSTPTPVFLTLREETQTMVREKLGPKPRPRQTLYLPGKGETQTMV